MSKNVYLISPAYVRTMSNASDNLQDKFLQSSIREAQDMGLQTILGECLYKAVLEMVNDGSIGDIKNVVYKEMLDIAQYYLLYEVLKQVVMISTFKINNIGVNVTSDDNVRTVTINEAVKVKDMYQSKADFYCKRLQEYLWENKENLPELKPCDCNRLRCNLYSAASTNVWLGGYRSKIMR